MGDIVQDDNTTWPNVTLPYNAWANVSFYNYNSTTKTLTAQSNLSSLVYLDSDNNRALYQVTVKLPLNFTNNVDQVMDFTRGVLVYSIASLFTCTESNLGLQISLRNLLDTIKNQSYGINTYLGKTPVEWMPPEVMYHQFQLMVQTPTETYSYYAFFDALNLSLTWVTP